MVKKNFISLIFIELAIISLSAGWTFWYFGNEKTPPPITEEISDAIPLETPNPTPTPMPTQTPEPSATPSAKPQLSANYKTVIATMFWVGEGADESNAFIPNDKSAWDANWQDSYGGIDDPENRCSYRPCDFTPKENPFYFALPYNDLDQGGNRKTSAKQIPWFDEYSSQKSVLKNRWVEISREGQSCYAQWQDVGPLETDDFEYVFGGGQPKNQVGAKAGIDLSPAVFDCLGMTTNEEVAWRFVPDSEVPGGPWKETVTSSPVGW